VRRDAEAERRLAHAWACGDDHEVPGLEPRRQPVEVAEAGGDSRDVGAGLVQRGDSLEALLEQILDVTELRRDSALRQVEDDLLGTVDEYLRLARAVPPELSDLLAGGDQSAQRRHLADDARVVRRIGGGRHERRQLVQAYTSADGL